MTADPIIWGPPPELKRRWLDRLAPFLGRPGEWGQLVETYDRRTIKDLRDGRHLLPQGQWDFEYRSVPQTNGRRIHIWARYGGPNADG